MGAKLKIVFLVILAGVFFFPPDGVDAQGAVGPEAPTPTTARPPTTTSGKKPLMCLCGTKLGPEARQLGTIDPDTLCHPEEPGSDRRVQSCPGGYCTKTFTETTGSETALKVVSRGCGGFPRPDRIPPKLACTDVTTTDSAPNKAGDKKTQMITCYCNSSDFCNSVAQLRGMSLTQLSVSAIFVGVIVSRIGGIQ